LIAKSICAQGLDDASFSHARWARDAVTQSFYEMTFDNRIRDQRTPYPLSAHARLEMNSFGIQIEANERPEGMRLRS
jgi:hypothetical protein